MREPLDRGRVQALIREGLIQPARVLELYNQIESELYRFPSVSPGRLRQTVESVAHSGTVK